MKEVANYILLVDSHKPYKRETSGRYRVGAKTEKEAITVLRNQIKFGSIQVSYKCSDVTVPYKGILKEI